MVTMELTEDEAEQIRFGRIETDAKSLAKVFGVTVQRVYQLEKLGVIARTKSGYYNLCDCVRDYIGYKRFGNTSSENLVDPDDLDADDMDLDIL